MPETTFNRIPELIRAIHEGAKRGIVTATKEGASDIQANAAVDTGYMRDSVYTVTSEGSTYQAGEKSLAEVDAPADDMTGVAAVAAFYGIFVEYGTRFMAAQPFVTPAEEKLRGNAGEIIGNALVQAINEALG